MDRVEQIAKALHDGWCEFKRAQQWRCGPRDDAQRTHPHLVSWEGLPEEENRNQDRFQASVILQRWTETLEPVTPEMIHEAWRLWEHLQGNFEHRHDLPYSDPNAHGGSRGPQEHEIQAAKVNDILKESRDIRLLANASLAFNEKELDEAYADPEWAAFENNCGKASR